LTRLPFQVLGGGFLAVLVFLPEGFDGLAAGLLGLVAGFEDFLDAVEGVGEGLVVEVVEGWFGWDDGLGFGFFSGSGSVEELAAVLGADVVVVFVDFQVVLGLVVGELFATFDFDLVPAEFAEGDLGKDRLAVGHDADLLAESVEGFLVLLVHSAPFDWFS